jgi:hypothetical protein
VADAFYTNLRDNTVKPLMDRFGFDMDLKSSRAPEIDPDTGEITTEAADVLTPVTGLFRFYSQDEINGVDIQANDIQALISGKETSDASLVPDTSMQLIAQGVTYNVVRVTPTQPGGVSVLYRLQIRK